MTSLAPDAAPTGMRGFTSVYQDLILGRSFVEYKDYYIQARRRYEQTAQAIEALGLPKGSDHLDIGGGQMALLARDLFGFAPTVGDVVETAAQDIISQGVAFQRVNLMDESYDTGRRYDLITLLEVIEHIPCPPYVTFVKLMQLLKPGGYLVLTTPNGYRIRNVLRMLTNREILDIYRYPDEDQPLGHQHEYTTRQMEWQLQHAGLQIKTCRTYISGWTGSSAATKLGHLLTKPFSLAPHLRDGLFAVAQMPEDKKP